tara:strand:+ start:243 stop:1139 length:897 start_codon:yes stop_codon:yes gene_type:complete
MADSLLTGIDENKISKVMSYSGADFTVLLHIPVSTANAKSQFLIQEIKDEIQELKFLLAEGEAPGFSNSRPSFPGPLVPAKTKYVASLQKAIGSLESTKTKLEQQKDVSVVPKRLTSLQTLSVQIHTDKQPVRGLGHSYPKGYTQGARLIAGSMIFTIIREHPLIEIIDTYNSYNSPDILNAFSKAGSGSSDSMFPSSATSDSLPPMHATILGVNEAGNAVNMTLFGVQFINDGVVLSIQDLMTESTISFVAQDIDLMRTLDTRGVKNIPAMSRNATASSLLGGDMSRMRRIRRGLPF